MTSPRSSYSLKNIARIGFAAAALSLLPSGCASLNNLGDPYIVRKDGRWFPEYRDHKIRTPLILLGEAGAMTLGVAAFGRNGGNDENGSGSKQAIYNHDHGDDHYTPTPDGPTGGNGSEGPAGR